MGSWCPFAACALALVGCALPDYQPMGEAQVDGNAVASSSAEGTGGATAASSSSSSAGGAGGEGGAPACTVPSLGGVVFLLGKRCVWLALPKRTWADAESECEAWGGKLMSIHSADEQFAIGNELDASMPFRVWIGGTDMAKEGTFVWVDTGAVFYENGTAFGYTHWGLGQPSGIPGDEDCVELEGVGWTWNDLACTYPAQFLCARPA